MKSTSERLKEIMEERHLRQVDILAKCEPFSKKYGVKIARNDLSQYVSGKFKPKQDKLSILALALGVNEAWLMGYEVAKERSDSNTPNIGFLEEVYQKLSSVELSESEQKDILNYIDFVLAKRERE